MTGMTVEEPVGPPAVRIATSVGFGYVPVRSPPAGPVGVVPPPTSASTYCLVTAWSAEVGSRKRVRSPAIIESPVFFNQLRAFAVKASITATSAPPSRRAYAVTVGAHYITDGKFLEEGRPASIR